MAQDHKELLMPLQTKGITFYSFLSKLNSESLKQDQQSTVHAQSPTMPYIPQQPFFNPFMPPMMPPLGMQPQGPQLAGSESKDAQPFSSMPYVVFPQPNGTFIIQPFYQMV